MDQNPRQDVQSPRGVIPLRDDTDITRALDRALNSFKEMEGILESNGFLSEIARLCLAIIQAIRFGRTDDQIADATLNFLDLLEKIERVLKVAPFSNPPPEGLRALGEELLIARQELAKLRSEVVPREHRLVELEQELAITRERREDLIHELDRIREDFTKLRQMDRGKLDRIVSAVGSISSRVREALIDARGRAELEAEIARLRSERRMAIGGDVSRAEEFLRSLEGTVRIFSPAETNTDKAAPDAPSPFSALTLPDTERIEAELERRRTWLTGLESTQLDGEEQRAAIEAEIEELEQRKKFGTASETNEANIRLRTLHPLLERMNAHIRSLVELKRHIRERIDEIERFREACTLVTTGLPSEIFTEDLPSIVPTANTVDEVAVESDRGVAEIREVTAVDETRRAKLIELASCHGLSERAVFLATLFELDLGRHPTSQARTNRPTLKMARIACEQNIAQYFGWRSPSEVLESWRGTEAEREQLKNYLSFSGLFGKMPTYRRTKTPLLWQASDLITKEEINAFTAEVMKPRESKTVP